MEDDNSNYNRDYGILVHQLPEELTGKTISILPKGIKTIFHADEGMRVFFCRKETADELIRIKHILVDGVLYNISSLVTCLTVYGGNNFAFSEIIKKYFSDKHLKIYDLYSIANTDNYRVIVDVPEVLANFKIPPISPLSNSGSKWPLDFYCRVCRREGHKRYQCLSQEQMNFITPSHGADDSNRELTGRNTITRFGSNRRFMQNNDAASSGAERIQGVCDPGPQRNQQNTDLLQTGEEPSTSTAPTLAERSTVARNSTNIKQNKGARKEPQRKPVRYRTKGRKDKFPCEDIRKIIPKVHGILSTERMCSFLEGVQFHNKPVFYAKKFTSNISALITQIKEIISCSFQQGVPDMDAYKDVMTLNEICCNLYKHS